MENFNLNVLLLASVLSMIQIRTRRLVIFVNYNVCLGSTELPLPEMSEQQFIFE